MTDNLPATQDEDRRKSQAEQQRERMAALMAAVEQRSDMLVTLLKESGIAFDRFREVLRRAIIKGQEKPETNLLLADAGSVIQACIDACTAGLLPDGKQGAIVIYNTNVAPRGAPKRWVKRAQFIPMYEGLLAIAYGSGNFKSIMATVVYDVDVWDYELGIDPWIKHKPGPRPPVEPPDPKPAGWQPYQVVAAYAVAKTVNGGVFVEVFEPEDIRKVMAVSRAKSGPAKDWPEQMARKGPLRRMWKFLPRNDRMEKVLELDDENYDLDALEPPKEEAAPSLKRGFAQLEQGADPVVDIPIERERDAEPARMDGAEEETRAYVWPDHPEEDRGNTDNGRGADPEDERPPRIREFDDKVNQAESWLSIKQALRSLLKAEDWDRERWTGPAFAFAWEKFAELGDRTDFVTDCLLFVAWLEGHDPAPTPEEIVGNLRVLEAQSDYKRASEDIQALVQARAARSTHD